MLNRIRAFARKNLFLRKIVGYHLASSGIFDTFFRNYELSTAWQERIKDVLSSSDNNFIPRVTDAGLIKNGKQVMHNGLKVNLGSYYGPEYSRMLVLSRGVHEPQEERVFMEVLKTMPKKAVMIEMGAFWSFYSMWFNKEVEQAVNFMIEPDEFNLGQGKRNFALNGMNGKFIHSFIADKSSENEKIPTRCIDDIVKEYAIDFVDILHSDIQGYEYDMLLGARGVFVQNKIGYVFISTHDNNIHNKCLQFLLDRNFIIIAAADIDQSFSQDGLIVARAPYHRGISSIDISKRK